MLELSGEPGPRPLAQTLVSRLAMRHLSRVARENVTKSRQEAGRAVRTRRVQRGMRSQQALADKADIDVKTVGKLERGEKIGETSMIALDIALGWEPGNGIQHLLAGEPPVEAESADSPATAIREEHREPDPTDYPDELEYLNAVYWYLRRGRNMSHEAVMRGFNMAAAIYTRKQSEAAAQRGEKPTEYPESRDGLIG